MQATCVRFHTISISQLKTNFTKIRPVVVVCLHAKLLCANLQNIIYKFIQFFFRRAALPQNCWAKKAHNVKVLRLHWHFVGIMFMYRFSKISFSFFLSLNNTSCLVDSTLLLVWYWFEKSAKFKLWWLAGIVALLFKQNFLKIFNKI